MSVIGQIVGSGLSAVTGGMSTVYKWLAIGGVLLALCVGCFFYGKHLGDLQSKVAIAAFEVKHQQELTDLLGMQIVTADKIVTQLVTKTKIIHDIGVNNENIANTIVPDHQFLSLGWLRTHDASAIGTTADPTSANDGTPSTTQANTALATVVDNYATCQANAAELSSLQQWINETNANIAKANKAHK
jgi:hypothetical protein